MYQNKSGVFFAFHLYRVPECAAFYSSLEEAVKLLKKHGYIPHYGAEFNDPYIQKARNNLVYRFLQSSCDTLFFIADDLKYAAHDMLRVLQAPGDVVGGVYPLKTDVIKYPAQILTDKDGFPVVREDGCIAGKWVQTGFLRINRNVFEKIISEYPDLAYYGIKDGKRVNVHHDFFPQGVYGHTWVGEDFAFCNLWRDIGGEIWIVPDIDFIHYDKDVGYPGNYHNYLKSLPGGIDYKE